MKALVILAAVFCAIAPFSVAGAAPLGSANCIVAEWSDDKATEVFVAINAKEDDSSPKVKDGRDAYLVRSRECREQNHWSEAAMAEANAFAASDMLVRIVAGNLRSFGSSVSILDRHFADNRQVYISRTDTRQYDKSAIAAAIGPAGFDVKNEKALDLVPVYFSFMALREQAGDRFALLER